MKRLQNAPAAAVVIWLGTILIYKRDFHIFRDFKGRFWHFGKYTHYGFISVSDFLFILYLDPH